MPETVSQRFPAFYFSPTNKPWILTHLQYPLSFLSVPFTTHIIAWHHVCIAVCTNRQNACLLPHTTFYYQPFYPYALAVISRLHIDAYL